LLTHSHADHSAAAPTLAERTGAPLWMAPGALGSGVPPAAVSRWIGAGDEVETDAGTLVAVPTPGHAPEHVAFLLRQGETRGAGLLFVGDHLMGEGDTTLVAPPEGDLAAYLESLERLRGLGAATMYPAHGPPITDPAAALERYAAHREARIAQVRDALREGGAATPAELVGRVYGPELHPGLTGAAEGSVRAILGYLEARGEALRGSSGRHALA
ncbi:MAG TPA: MBL fold metallo-hydrolase, partial [Longimicrobiaceae bacterium]|nr:MBL fold metallo-hydrolase [Longimicrobiaceae bacterium]